MTLVKITTIIATHNAKKWIEDCLIKLELSSIKTDIIVIDNCSSDNTTEIIKTKFPNVRLFKSKENLGFGKANNLGINIALESHVDYIFLLNQDAWVLPNTIENLIKCSAKHKEALIISPIHQNTLSNGMEHGFKSYLSHSDIKELNLNRDVSVKFINAAIWLLPVKSFEIIGGFNPIFPHYGEDFNYCQRVVFHGFKIIVTPEAIAFHERLKNFKSEEPRYTPNLIDGLIECSNPQEDTTKKSNFNYTKSLLKHGILELLNFRINSFVNIFIIIIKLTKLRRKCKSNRELSRISGGYNFLNLR